MYAFHLAQTAYTPAGAAMKSAKDVEYDAFATVTSAMKRATTMPETARALGKNRQLWMILAVDVADDANALPAELRAQILSWAKFVDQHTSKVLNKTGEIDVLIEINASMMRGLRGHKVAAA